MTAWEYFLQGSWCMYLIAISGLILYTLLFERFLAAYALRHQQIRMRSEFDLMFLQIRRSEHLVIIRALIAAIPLLGLLGTVTGMMDSFAGMRGNQASVGMGISQALITTQYGLLLATPALLIERFISYRIEQDAHHDRRLLSERSHA